MMTFPIYGKIKNVPNHQPEKLGTSEDIGMLPQTDIRISMMTLDIGKLGDFIRTGDSIGNN